jgi:5,10-methylenetetrahydromethanopterin reductase
VSRVVEFGLGMEHVEARRQIACARRAEELGYGTYWVPEDYFFRGAYALAGAVANATSRMRIGLGVVNPYTRHPALIAMETATLDEISGGRAVLGIGASVKYWIEHQMKIPYARPTGAMRETIEIVRRLLREETLTYEGKSFRTEAAKLNFKPPRPVVPIQLGVIGPKNLEMAGEIADGVQLSAMTSPAYVRFAVERIRAGAERAGRDPDAIELGAFLFLSISENEKQARDAVKPFIATLIALLAGQPESPLFTAPGLAPEEIRAIGAAFAGGELPLHLVTDWMVDTFAVAGSPERCRESFAKLVEAGIRHPVAFEIPGTPIEETIESVHRYLMAHFL